MKLYSLTVTITCLILAALLIGTVQQVLDLREVHKAMIHKMESK